MKFQEGPISNPSDPEPKPKTKGVIILKDNRPKGTPSKSSQPDFRQSAFKETEVDPSEPWAQLNLHHDQDFLIQTLTRKVLVLEQRIKRLQQTALQPQNQADSLSEQKDRKSRRKFVQMERNHKCPVAQCQRIYGSQTSLRHHLKLKHKINLKSDPLGQVAISSHYNNSDSNMEEKV